MSSIHAAAVRTVLASLLACPSLCTAGSSASSWAGADAGAGRGASRRVRRAREEAVGPAGATITAESATPTAFSAGQASTEPPPSCAPALFDPAGAVAGGQMRATAPGGAVACASAPATAANHRKSQAHHRVSLSSAPTHAGLSAAPLCAPLGRLAAAAEAASAARAAWSAGRGGGKRPWVGQTIPP